MGSVVPPVAVDGATATQVPSTVLPPSAAPSRTTSDPAAALSQPSLPQEISSLLTVVITTSPTPSAPSTDLVSAVLASFRAHCPALLACPVIVVFDTYDRVGPRSRLKKGSVTAAEAKNYIAYKENVQQLVHEVWGTAPTPTANQVEHGEAEYGSPFLADNSVKFTITRIGDGRVAFVEPAARLGFALAVRTAVRAAATPYVWIQQHDWILAADVPLAAMLDVMRTSEFLVAHDAQSGQHGFPDMAEAGLSEEEGDAEDLGDDVGGNDDESFVEESSAGLSFSSLSSDSASDSEEAVPIRYICLPSIRMLRYAVSTQELQHPTLRHLTATLKRRFPTTSTASPTATVSPAEFPAPSNYRLPLTPLFFWHDKPHVASASHYLARIFPSRLAVSRGDFIEDHVGQRARAQMKRDPALFRKWACWLYYPDDGNLLCLRHLQGRTWRGEEKEQEMRDLYRERNRSAASAAAAIAAEAAKTAQPVATEEGPTGNASSTATWGTTPFEHHNVVNVFDGEEIS